MDDRGVWTTLIVSPGVTTEAVFLLSLITLVVNINILGNSRNIVESMPFNSLHLSRWQASIDVYNCLVLCVILAVCLLNTNTAQLQFSCSDVPVLVIVCYFAVMVLVSAIVVIVRHATLLYIQDHSNIQGASNKTQNTDQCQCKTYIWILFVFLVTCLIIAIYFIIHYENVNAAVLKLCIPDLRVRVAFTYWHINLICYTLPILIIICLKLFLICSAKRINIHGLELRKENDNFRLYAFLMVALTSWVPYWILLFVYGGVFSKDAGTISYITLAFLLTSGSLFNVILTRHTENTEHSTMQLAKEEREKKLFIP